MQKSNPFYFYITAVFFTVALFSSLFSSLANANPRNLTGAKDIPDNKGVEYTIMLLNVIDEGKYQLYRKAMRPVFEAAGGVLEREFSIGAKVNGNLELGPVNRMILFYYNTANGGANLVASEGYKKVRPMMDAAVDNIKFIQGRSLVVGMSGSDLDNRAYVIKITDFNELDATTARKAVVSKIVPYKMRKERVIKVERMNIKQKVDQLAIYYWDSEQARQKMLADKALLQAFGEFNKTYTHSFAYLTLTAMSGI